MAKPFSKHIYTSRRWAKCAKAFAESKLYICERCGRMLKMNTLYKTNYVVHHRQPLTPATVTDDLMVYGWDNLQLLCTRCHRAVHGMAREGRAMQFDEDGNLIGAGDMPPVYVGNNNK